MTTAICDRIRLDLKAYSDGALSLVARWKVKRHLRSCEACRLELADVVRIGKELHNMAAEIETDAGPLDPALRARILAAIPQGVPPETNKAPRIPIRIPAFPTFAVAGAAVACVAVYMVWPRAQTASITNQTAMIESRESITAPAGSSASPPAGNKAVTMSKPQVYSSDQNLGAAAPADSLLPPKINGKRIALNGSFKSPQNGVKFATEAPAPMSSVAGPAERGKSVVTKSALVPQGAADKSRDRAVYLIEPKLDANGTITVYADNVDTGVTRLRTLAESISGRVSSDARSVGNASADIVVQVPEDKQAQFTAMINDAGPAREYRSRNRANVAGAPATAPAPARPSGSAPADATTTVPTGNLGLRGGGTGVAGGSGTGGAIAPAGGAIAPAGGAGRRSANRSLNKSPATEGFAGGGFAANGAMARKTEATPHMKTIKIRVVLHTR